MLLLKPMSPLLKSMSPGEIKRVITNELTFINDPDPGEK